MLPVVINSWFSPKETEAKVLLVSDVQDQVLFDNAAT